MTWEYTQAENGNVALTGEIDLPACGRRVRAGRWASAASSPRPATAPWPACTTASTPRRPSTSRPGRTGRTSLLPLGHAAQPRDAGPLPHQHGRSYGSTRPSTSPAASSPACRSPGASPRATTTWAATTWSGRATWSRRPAASWRPGHRDDARRVLHYLQVTQEADGHWPQNMWLDGTPYWDGIQMDETAFPILLVDLARREGALDAGRPGSASGRWSRGGRVPRPQRPGHAGGPLGGGPRLLAVHPGRRDRRPAGRRRPGRPARRAGRGHLPARDGRRLERPHRALDLRRPAPTWPARSASRATTSASPRRSIGRRGLAAARFVPIKNRPPEQSNAGRPHIISPDALALVRFGLRAAGRPADRQHRQGHRRPAEGRDAAAARSGSATTSDGYGEHEDGSPFDGTGVGRPWPLLTGERAHYELAAGAAPRRERLLRRLEAFANDGGLIPEQVWDAPDVPERELFFGRPSGSAMPLVWAHAEYVKLRRSLRDGRVFDMPPADGPALHRGEDRLAIRASGASTTSARIRPARRCASRRWRRPSSTGAPTAGRRPMTPRRATRRLASTWPTCLPLTLRLGRPSTSRSTGPQRIGGKVSISPC